MGFDRAPLMKERETLWCPVRNKYIADRPEERIRLWVIERLRAHGYPLSALQVEYKVENAGRFDLAVFMPKGDIWLLVECKQASPGKDPLQLAMQARVQLERYAQALEKRWRVHHLGLAFGQRLYCLDYITRQWLQEVPLYPSR